MDLVCCIQGLQNVLYIFYRIQINKIRNNNPEILNGGCGGGGGPAILEVGEGSVRKASVFQKRLILSVMFFL